MSSRFSVSIVHGEPVRADVEPGGNMETRTISIVADGAYTEIRISGFLRQVRDIVEQLSEALEREENQP